MINIEQATNWYKSYRKGEYSEKEFYKKLISIGWYGEITSEDEAERVIDKERKGY